MRNSVHDDDLYHGHVMALRRFVVTFGLQAALVEAPTKADARKVVADYIESRAPSRSGGWDIRVRPATRRDERVWADSGVAAASWAAKSAKRRRAA